MDYSKLSDFEINKRVADIEMNGTWHVKPSHPDNDTGGWLYGPNGIQTYDLPDYCNNAADAWPIISQNKITLHAPMSYDDLQEWLCFAANDSDADCMNTNPLRAAMIVFLKMQESANVPANPAGPDIR